MSLASLTSLVGASWAGLQQLQGTQHSKSIAATADFASGSGAASAATQTTDKRPPAGPPPATPPGTGASAQSIIEALSVLSDGDTEGDTASSGHAENADGAISDLLAKILSSVDTNGDGQVSEDELSAFASALSSGGDASGTAMTIGTLEGSGLHADEVPPGLSDARPPRPEEASSRGAAPESVYKSVFDALSQQQDPRGMALDGDLSNQFLNLLSEVA